MYTNRVLVELAKQLELAKIKLLQVLKGRPKEWREDCSPEDRRHLEGLIGLQWFMYRPDLLLLPFLLSDQKRSPRQGLSLFPYLLFRVLTALSVWGDRAKQGFHFQFSISEEARPAGMRTGYGSAPLTKPKPHGVTPRSKGWTPERPAQRQQGREPTARSSESRARRRRGATR